MSDTHDPVVELALIETDAGFVLMIQQATAHNTGGYTAYFLDAEGMPSNTPHVYAERADAERNARWFADLDDVDGCSNN